MSATLKPNSVPIYYLQLKMVFLFVVKEQIQIFFEILLVLKYILTVVPSCQYMIDMLLGSYSCGPRHGLNVPFHTAFVN